VTRDADDDWSIRITIAVHISQGDEAMLYELRVYTALPGRMPKLLTRFKDHTIAIWQKHGIVPIGFWMTLIGPDSVNDLTYILAWESLADRETKWNAFLSDPECARRKRER
jgi:NIPSNAP